MEMNPKETAILDQLIKATDDYAIATGIATDWEHGVDAHGFAYSFSSVGNGSADGWLEFRYSDMGDDEITIQAGFCHDGDCAGCIDLGMHAYPDDRITKCPECGEISGARLLSGAREIGQFLAIAYVYLGTKTPASGYSRIINRPLVEDYLAGGHYCLTATDGPYTIRLFPNCDCCDCHVTIQRTNGIKDSNESGEIDLESGLVWYGELIEIIQEPLSNETTTTANYIVVAS
jgi:hypothetical protein